MGAPLGIIYYTDGRLEGGLIAEVVRAHIAASGLPIVSCSRNAPLVFGERNVVVEGERSYVTMIRQIIAALETHDAEAVYFCEHDVLYPRNHFMFTPPAPDLWCYNAHVWRWKLWDHHLITYDRMWPLSCLCVNRAFALDHYRRRMAAMDALGLDEFRSREPRWARRWGYEPGTKLRRRGGFSDDAHLVWRSETPVIDIRHKQTFSRLKCDQTDFRHPPTGWREIPADQVPGWDLAALFTSLAHV